LKIRPAALCAALGAAVLTGCKDSNAPQDPRGIRSVFVGMRVDPAALRDRGEFVLALVPVDGNGQVVLSDALDVTPRLSTPDQQDLPPVSKVVQEPDPRPVAAAVSLDDSRSMGNNDPNGRRTDAARLFWTEILAGASTNQVALLSFGGGQPTAPFKETALLQDWTTDASLLEAGLSRLVTTGDTFLYESTAEIAGWITSTRPGAFRRIMLLVTDGMPSDADKEQEAIDAAVAGQIPVFTVGIGPASDQSSAAVAAAVDRLRTLANRTGGVYAGAENTAELSTVFESLAKVTTEGALLVTVRMSPAPVAGTKVSGSVRVGNQYGAATANWSFDAP
jgi:hypothetical protein